MTSSVRRGSSLALLCVIIGAAYGAAISAVPSPSSVTVFWVGNFSAPWALLAFATGALQRRPVPAAVAAIVTEMACVAGFYARDLSADPARLGLPGTTPLTRTLTVSVTRWAVFVAPWMLAAVGAGLVYGVTGWWWRRTRTRWAVATLALPFFIEPFVWPVYNHYYRGPTFYWAAEVLVGAVLAKSMWTTSQPTRQLDA